ncbi:MAG: hypothetical protein KF721_10220 [Ignavibacteriaceae bacterium]|nr:hypothetical protein [Ignavibacteriaceae bacterium]
MNKSQLIILLLFVLTETFAQQLAFPGAEGYGRFTSGGRGGKVIFVTNLNDSGDGSLRDAIKKDYPRTILFSVSGTINLKSELEVKHGNLTIAGQTAPGDGICIKGNRFTVNANNVIIRFIRFRIGDESGIPEDALSIMWSKNIIVDHCSMSWGVDEVASFYDSENTTMQWCIISEALNKSIHPKGAHGYGGIWGGVNASFHHNLLAHNSSRNPRFNGSRTKTSSETELVDFRNNVIYNWGENSSYGGESGKHNMVANYYKSGPASHKKDRILEPFDSKGRWYIDQNIVEGFSEVSNDNWNGGVQGEYAVTNLIKSDFPFGDENVRTESASEALKSVLKLAGATYPKRDKVDLRIIDEVSKGTVFLGNGIINSQTEVGGYPELNTLEPLLDTDKDGIPDFWEKLNNLDFTNRDDGNKLSESGYTFLEEYLNEIVKGAYDK